MRPEKCRRDESRLSEYDHSYSDGAICCSALCKVIESCPELVKNCPEVGITWMERNIFMDLVTWDAGGERLPIN